MKVSHVTLALSVLVLAKVCHGSNGDEDEGPSAMAVLMKCFVIGSIAAIAAYLVVFPVDFVRKTGEYKARKRHRWYMAPIALVEAMPVVLPKLVDVEGAMYLGQRLLMFAPRVIIKLGMYDFVRGPGKPNFGKIVVGAVVAGVASLIYAFPFHKIEVDQSINSGRFTDLLKILQEKASRRGITSLYHGITAAIPYAMVYHLVLFLSMEIISMALKNKLPMNIVAAASAVVVSAIFASPLEQLRKIIVAFPLDYDQFLFGYDRDPHAQKRLNPDFRMLIDYALFILRKWTERGVFHMFGRVHMRVNTVATCLALFLNHTMFVHYKVRVQQN